MLQSVYDFIVGQYYDRKNSYLQKMQTVRYHSCVSSKSMNLFILHFCDKII